MSSEKNEINKNLINKSVKVIDTCGYIYYNIIYENKYILYGGKKL
jgi:hypothetical protein